MLLAWLSRHMAALQNRCNRCNRCGKPYLDTAGQAWPVPAAAAALMRPHTPSEKIPRHYTLYSTSNHYYT